MTSTTPDARTRDGRFRAKMDQYYRRSAKACLAAALRNRDGVGACRRSMRNWALYWRLDMAGLRIHPAPAHLPTNYPV